MPLLMTRGVVAAAAALAVVGCSGSAQPDAGPGCGQRLTQCGAVCADLKLSDEHCGSCGHACLAAEACAGGECYPRDCSDLDCTLNYACLAQRCAERACVGVICPSGETCFEGACQPTTCGGGPCPAGAVCRAGTCLDTRCVGVLCPGASQCRDGSCTPTCQAGAACPLPNVCQVGVIECSTGAPQCVLAGVVTDGTPCSTGTCTLGRCIDVVVDAGTDGGVDGGTDAGTPLPPSVYFAATNTFAAQLPRATFSRTTVDLGPPAADRVVTAMIGVRTNARAYVTAVSIGGVAATRQVRSPAHVYDVAEIWTAVVPTGTTGQTVTLTLSVAPSTVVLTVYSLYELRGPTAHASAGDSVDPCSATLDVPPNGLVVAVAYHSNNTMGTTWAGVTERFDGTAQGTGHYFTIADEVLPAGAAARIITADFASATDDAMAAASFQGR